MGRLPVRPAGRAARGRRRGARLERHRRAAHPGRLHPRRPEAVGPDVRPGAGRGRRDAASIVHNAYGYGLFTGGLGIHQGAIELGATVVPVSGGMTSRQVTLIRDLRPDILTCTPSYAIRLGEALAEAGAGPELGPDAEGGIFGAEPWTDGCAPGSRTCSASARSTSTGCPRSSGPASPPSASSPPTACTSTRTTSWSRRSTRSPAAPVPTARPASWSSPRSPRRRCRCCATGPATSPRCAADRARCGRTLVRMSKVTGRKDDMLVIRGVNVYPSEVERVLLAAVRARAGLPAGGGRARSRSTGCIACCEYDETGSVRPGRPPS